MSFAALKKNRKGTIGKLVKSAEEATTKATYGDDRLWQPQVDKAGNGFAIIRFLPEAPDNDLPWARYWSHGFQGPTGRWYIENSLTSIGQDDPVSEANSLLWNSGHDEDKKTARERKRRLHYMSNILVVSDPSNPDNDGKQFLYKFGKKIFDKIMDTMQPAFADEDPVNPFDFWDGADFKVKIRKVEGYRNYDKSEFATPSPILGGDDKLIEGVYDKLVDLREFTDPKNYKSYSDLKKKMLAVLGEEAPALDAPSAPAPEPRETEAAPAAREEAPADDADETVSYFEKLAKG